MVVIILYFFTLLILFIRSRSYIFILLLSIQILSLLGAPFIGRTFEIDSIYRVFNLFFTILILTLVILPWKKFRNIKQITHQNEIKLQKVTRLLLYISGPTFIILTITSILVFILVDDINEFKYTEGVSVEFYYNLPYNVKFFILATYLHYFGYFLIPLHFYYFYKKNYKYAILCLVFSLTIVLNGLTYFSRSVIVHYLLIYLSLLFALINTFDYRLQRTLKRTLILLLGISITYFVITTNKRFKNDSAYSNIIPSNSLIQDPVLYSYFDYLSQSYYNGQHVLDLYSFKNLNGQISLQPILSLLGQYGIINYKSESYIKQRKLLWPDNWYTFNGLVAYSVYDFGYILTFLMACIYYYYIRSIKIIDGSISFISLQKLVLLIQIPLFAIFYSSLSIIIIPFTMLVAINFYLKIKLKH